MKRLSYIVLMLALPVVASAQVAKQVEVTKDYVPMVKSAQKLSVIPDMTDTVTMQPDIEYEITPRSYQTSMLVENFRPATITYWDFNRSRPFYLRGAFGVPLTSEADLYVSTYNKDRGYAMAYVNHWGDYRNRHNYLGDKVTSDITEMSNRVGGRAGLIVRRHMLEVDIYGDQQLRHRYPALGEKILFGNVAGKIRFGDDFTDMSRWNFNIEIGGNIFGENYVPEGAQKHNQSQANARFELGKLLGGRHIFKVHAGYTGVFGSAALSEYTDNTVMAGLRYGISGRRMEFLIGGDYYYDKLDGSTDSPHKVFPYLKLTWKNTSEKFVPYVEVDGGIRRHDYGSLIYENPYLRLPEGGEEAFLAIPNESVYNGRVGFGGNFGGGVFAYDVSAELALNDNHFYWYSYNYSDYNGTNAYQQSLAHRRKSEVPSHRSVRGRVPCRRLCVGELRRLLQQPSERRGGRCVAIHRPQDHGGRDARLPQPYQVDGHGYEQQYDRRVPYAFDLLPQSRCRVAHKRPLGRLCRGPQPYGKRGV